MPSVSHRSRQHPPVETYFLDDTATQWVQGSSLTGCELDQCPQCGEIQVSDLRRDVKQIGLGPVFILKSRVTDINRLDIGYKIILVCFTNDVLRRLFGIWLDFMGVPTGSSTNMVHPWWLPDDRFGCRRPSLMTRAELLRLGLHLIKYLGRSIYFDYERVWSLQSKTSELGVKEQMSARAHQHRRWMRSNLKQLYRSILAERRHSDRLTDGTEAVIFALPRIPDDTFHVGYLQIPTVLLDQPNQESVYLGGFEVPIPPHAFPLVMKDLCLLHEQKLEYVINECLRRDPFSAFVLEDCLQIDEDKESNQIGAISRSQSNGTPASVINASRKSSFATTISAVHTVPITPPNFLPQNISGLGQASVSPHVSTFVNYNVPGGMRNDPYDPNNTSLSYGNASMHVMSIAPYDVAAFSVQASDAQVGNHQLFGTHPSATNNVPVQEIRKISDFHPSSTPSLTSSTSPSLESVTVETPDSGNTLAFNVGTLGHFTPVNASAINSFEDSIPVDVQNQHPNPIGFLNLNVGAPAFNVDVSVAHSDGRSPSHTIEASTPASHSPQTPINHVARLSPQLDSQTWDQFSVTASPVQSSFSNEQASSYVVGPISPVDPESPTIFASPQTPVFSNGQPITCINSHSIIPTLDCGQAIQFVSAQSHYQTSSQPVHETPLTPPAFFRVELSQPEDPQCTQSPVKKERKNSLGNNSQYPGVVKRNRSSSKKGKAKVQSFEFITTF